MRMLFFTSHLHSGVIAAISGSAHLVGKTIDDAQQPSSVHTATADHVMKCPCSCMREGANIFFFRLTTVLQGLRTYKAHFATVGTRQEG